MCVYLSGDNGIIRETRNGNPADSQAWNSPDRDFVYKLVLLYIIISFPLL